jgi:hypothetical protein
MLRIHWYITCCHFFFPFCPLGIFFIFFIFFRYPREGSQKVPRRIRQPFPVAVRLNKSNHRVSDLNNYVSPT